MQQVWSLTRFYVFHARPRSHSDRLRAIGITGFTNVPNSFNKSGPFISKKISKNVSVLTPDLRIVHGCEVFDQVSLAVDIFVVLPLFFAHQTFVHQPLDVKHVTVVFHRRFVNFSQMLLVVVVVTQLFVPTQLTLVEIRVSPFFKRLFIGSFHFSAKNTLHYFAGRVTI